MLGATPSCPLCPTRDSRVNGNLNTTTVANSHPFDGKSVVARNCEVETFVESQFQTILIALHKRNCLPRTHTPTPNTHKIYHFVWSRCHPRFHVNGFTCALDFFFFVLFPFTLHLGLSHEFRVRRRWHIFMSTFAPHTRLRTRQIVSIILALRICSLFALNVCRSISTLKEHFRLIRSASMRRYRPDPHRRDTHTNESSEWNESVMELVAFRVCLCLLHRSIRNYSQWQSKELAHKRERRLQRKRNHLKNIHYTQSAMSNQQIAYSFWFSWWNRVQRTTRSRTGTATLIFRLFSFSFVFADDSA